MSIIGLPEDWGICGCANEPAIRLLRDLLRVMTEEAPASIDAMVNSPEKSQALKVWIHEHIERRHRVAGGEAQWELFMHFIDLKGWGEHGGGINSSWLTSEGKLALETLNGLDLDDPN